MTSIADRVRQAFGGVYTYPDAVAQTRLERLKRWQPATAAELLPNGEPLWCWATPRRFHEAARYGELALGAGKNYCCQLGTARLGLCPLHDAEILG